MAKKKVSEPDWQCGCCKACFSVDSLGNFYCPNHGIHHKGVEKCTDSQLQEARVNRMRCVKLLRRVELLERRKERA